MREFRQLRYLPLVVGGALVFLALLLLTQGEPGFHPAGNAGAGTMSVAGALEPAASWTNPAAGADATGNPSDSAQPAANPPGGDGQGGDGQGGGGGGGGQGSNGGQGGGGVRAGTATPELPSGILALIGLLPLGLAGLWLRRRGAAPGRR